MHNRRHGRISPCTFPIQGTCLIHEQYRSSDSRFYGLRRLVVAGLTAITARGTMVCGWGSYASRKMFQEEAEIYLKIY